MVKRYLNVFFSLISQDFFFHKISKKINVFGKPNENNKKKNAAADDVDDNDNSCWPLRRRQKQKQNNWLL